MVNQGEIEERIDPQYVFDAKRKDSLSYAYPTYPLKELLSENPQYGANERAVDKKSVHDVRYIRITDIDEFGELRGEEGKTAEKIEEKYLLKDNDVLFARSGATAGKTFIFKESYGTAIFAGYLIRFRLDSLKISPQYLFYFTQLTPYLLWVKSIQRPSAQPNINSQEFKSLEIPLPPMDVQADIVALMETAYATKRQKEAEAQALLASIDAYVLEKLGITLPTIEKRQCFGVMSSTIEGSRLDGEYYGQSSYYIAETLKKTKFQIQPSVKVFDKITSGARPTGGVSQIIEGVPSLGGEHVLATGEIQSQDLKFIPFEYHLTHLDSKVNPLDILLVKDGATTGKVGIVPSAYPYIDVNINEHVFLLRVKNGYNPYYIFAYLRSSFGQAQIQKEITGATVTGITKSVFQTLQIPLPPKALQDEIATEVQHRMDLAKQLKTEAKQALETAKHQVEALLFGA